MKAAAINDEMTALSAKIVMGSVKLKWKMQFSNSYFYRTESEKFLLCHLQSLT